MRRLALFALGLAAAAPAAAQEGVYVIRSSPAWLGISYELQWLQKDGACTPRVVVDGVVHGSPAERAGLRAGDAITAVDGEPLPPGRLQAIAARLVPGDSVRLRLVRDGTTREVTAVAGRRPDRPLGVSVETKRLGRSVPVIELTGDTLVARELTPEWDPGRVRSYWIVQDDGRAEYRTLGGWSSTQLDERVSSLLACADSASVVYTRRDGDGTTVTTELRRVQARADSIRFLINRRAREREGTEPLLRPAPPDSGATAPGTPRTVEIQTSDGRYSFRFEDHVTVGLRAVAGAELTVLEPELADYFRNADDGLLVLRVAPGTPADRAGLRPGDVVTAADGRRVESVAELRQIIALHRAGDVELQVVRKGRVRALTLRRD
ncbi:MAG: PDZ domain-containing protein [Longimicrobiales bacterium]|nr:PDZ domain-containing protein [Longimicrobiales bacterium]